MSLCLSVCVYDRAATPSAQAGTGLALQWHLYSSGWHSEEQSWA